VKTNGGYYVSSSTYDSKYEGEKYVLLAGALKGGFIVVVSVGRQLAAGIRFCTILLYYVNNILVSRQTSPIVYFADCQTIYI